MYALNMLVGSTYILEYVTVAVGMRLNSLQVSVISAQRHLLPVRQNIQPSYFSGSLPGGCTTAINARLTIIPSLSQAIVACPQIAHHLTPCIKCCSVGGPGS